MRSSTLTYLFIITLLLVGCSKKPSAVPPKTPPTEEPKIDPPKTTYVPGVSYKSYVQSADGTGTKYVAVAYIAGDIQSRLIISAPHGGSTQPSYIRTRTDNYNYGNLSTDPYNNDKSFSAIADGSTKELAEDIADSIKKKTGLRPHLIVNYLHRSKLDANRRIEVASQGDTNAENSWKAFQGYIDDAKKTISDNHPSGLLVDIHGNGHTPQRTEVGYLIDKDDFTTYANSLGNLANNTSIKAMVNTNITLTSLLVGNYALGTLINEKLGVLTTPSKAYPKPADKLIFTDELYFNGGYITSRHGSKRSGNISAIQLEFNSTVRTNSSTRPKNAGLVADALKTYLDKYFQ